MYYSTVNFSLYINSKSVVFYLYNMHIYIRINSYILKNGKPRNCKPKLA